MVSQVSETSLFAHKDKQLAPYLSVIKDKGLTDKEVNKFISSIGLLSPKEGTLICHGSGRVFVKVDDAYIKELLPLIKKRGFQEPPFFGFDQYGAHITAAQPLEIINNAKFFVVPISKITYTIKAFVTLQTDQWHGVKYIAVLQVVSPELEEIRQGWGLSTKPKGNDFVITIGIINEVVTKQRRELESEKKIAASKKEMSASLLSRSVEFHPSASSPSYVWDDEKQKVVRTESKLVKKAISVSDFSHHFIKKNYMEIWDILSKSLKEPFEEAVNLFEITEPNPKSIETFIASTISLFDCSGTLRKGDNGSIYLKVDDFIVHCYFPYVEKGLKKAPFFEDYQWGAHITVIPAKESVQTDITPFKDEKIPFTFKGFTYVEPQLWRGVKRCGVIVVDCPRLQEIRRKHGLSPTFKGHDFHITICIEPAEKPFFDGCF